MFISRVNCVIHRYRVWDQKESGIAVRRLNAHNFYRDYFLYSKLVFLYFVFRRILKKIKQLYKNRWFLETKFIGKNWKKKSFKWYHWIRVWYWLIIFNFHLLIIRNYLYVFVNAWHDSNSDENQNTNNQVSSLLVSALVWQIIVAWR